MATLAVSSKLPAVYVRVAIGAVAADVLEHQAGVALRTTDLLVHAPQGIPGLIVIEFGV